MIRFLRHASASGLAFSLAVALVTVGCGASHGAGADSPGDGAGIPDAIVGKLRACVAQGGDHLKEATYALHFDVEVSENGHVERVKRRESRPEDSSMESCMADALEGMVVPLSAVRALIPQEEAVSTEERALIGNPILAVIAAVELAPAIVVAAAVTAVVGVSVYATTEVIEALRRRPKCDSMMLRCINNPRQPEWNRSIFGEFKDCGLAFAIV